VQSGHPTIVVGRDGRGVAVVALSGEHDDFTAVALANTIQAEFADGRDVIVDLSQTTFLDSTCAGALIAARRAAETKAVQLVIFLPETAGWPVQRLFETARLDSILEVVSTLEAAYGRTRVGREDRRTGQSRRNGGERRRGMVGGHVLERRSGGDRRAGGERRRAA
jgi:anti-anti-sigma factor